MSKGNVFNLNNLLALLFLVLSVIWGMVIFGFSSQDAKTSSNLSYEVAVEVVDTLELETTPAQIEHPIRKMAHLSEYALFGALLFLSAAFKLRGRGTPMPRAVFFSVPVSAVYAASDEFHQGFSEGRSPQVTDVLIDTAGALCAALLIILIIMIVNRIKNKNTQA